MPDANRQPPEYIKLEDLINLPNYYVPAANPAADKIAFYSDQTGRLELYVADLYTREARQISDGQVPRSVRSNLCWTRNGNEVIYGKDADGNEKHDLFAINIHTGATRQLTRDPGAQEYAIEPSPDGKWLSVLSDKTGQLNLWKIRPDGTAYVNMTNYENPVLTGGWWSPDGEWLAFNVNTSPDMLNFDGYIIRADAGEIRQVLRVREGSEDTISDWHPGGRLLAVSSDANGVHRPGLLDLVTGDIRWLGAPEDMQIDEIAVKFSGNGRWLLTERNHEAEMRSALYDVATGDRRDLKLPPGQALATDWLLDDRALLIYLTTESRRPERGIYWLETDTYEPLLPALYGTLAPERFVDGQHLYYPSADGKSIPALLYHPEKLPVDQKLPAILIVHGGPTDQFFRTFDPFVQVLVDRGYVVLEPNIRGSTGYGVEFRDAALHDWGGGDLADVVAGAEYLKTLPYVDGERLAIFGGSYGGYMVYMALTRQPDVFRAGVAWAGITDLGLLYKDLPGHFQYYLRQQMGDPLEKVALWHDRSPVNFVEAMTAALLILHGENDPRCPLNQASVFRDKLVALGKTEPADFEYYVLGDEGHGSEDVEQRVRVFRLLVNFLERCL
jgi:dipeptidyl aminopeptidase/acylaminoacyl peptidase